MTVLTRVGSGVRGGAGALLLAAVMGFGGAEIAAAQDAPPVHAAVAKPIASKPAQSKPASVHTAAATSTAVATHRQPDSGTTGSVPPNTAAASGVAGKPYYIEFRSRSAQSYGHTFSIYGKLNGGRIVSKTVAGLHPATESPVPWMIGHVVLVPSETGASDGDTEDEYVTARFRVVMNEAEYNKVVGFIKALQAKSPVWHAVLYNCNAWVGDIAKFMGMETPASTMLMPEDYITSLRDLNINRQSAEMIGTPVKVESAQALRAVALRQKAANAKRAAASNAAAATSSAQ